MTIHSSPANSIGRDIGTESELVDQFLDGLIDDQTREGIWKADQEILEQGPVAQGRSDSAIGLALGYVQSGKTTTITALAAAAADDGYRVIVALLGSTNLLLDQNQDRIETALSIGVRQDYRWKIEVNPKGKKGAKSIAEWLERDRTLFLPVLKHAGRIRDLAAVLEELSMTDVPTLIIDDEADQAARALWAR